MRALSVLAMVVCVTGGSHEAAGQTRGVTFDDLIGIKAVGSPRISPDAARVLFTVRGWEPVPGRDDRKEARSRIWLVGASGATPESADARQVTFGERGETAPSWSPDGRSIGFLAARGAASGPEGPDREDPKPQLWVMRADGGEAWKLTEATEGVVSYAWSPDSTRIAFTTRDPLSEEAERRRKRRDDPRVYEGDFRHLHLWMVDVASQQATRLTDGSSFNVEGEPSWSPDGKRLVFAAAPTPMTRDDRQDVYILDVATRAVERITASLGPDGSPVWSPDGSTIAFISTPNSGKPNGDGIPLGAIGNAHLMLYDVARRETRDATRSDFDLSPGQPTWTPDGKRIIFTAGKRVYREAFSYEPASGRYTQLTQGLTVSLGSLSKDGSRVAFTMDSPTAPADVYVADSAGFTFRAPVRLTTVNPQTAGFSLGETEVITWQADGVEIEGVLLKPVGFRPGARYPLLVVAHGGPTAAHVNGFRVSYGDGGQHWAGQGWVVLYPNPRGSTNYGEKFMRANIPDWGGGDYRDIMAGVDAVIARGVADPDRLAVMGWSYGGYLTCWIVSQTQRFKAAMMGAGITNVFSMYGTNDVPNYLGTFFNGLPSKTTLPLYLARSGLTYANRVTTPLLILHGGNDERVPIGQPMEFFRALKDLGKTVELVFYPREGHGLSEYYHQLDRLKRQYEWITRHTLGEPGRKTTTQ